MQSDLLFYTFIGIFIVTAILTLASLPGWINIPENYKKVLFSALLLEVVGCVILLFKQQVFTTIEVKPKSDWIALSTSTADIIHPEIHFNDSIIPLGDSKLQAQEKMTSHEFRLEQKDKNLVITGLKNDLIYGKVRLDNIFLFNDIKSEGNEITGSTNYRILKFSRENSGSWNMKGAFFAECPLKIEVADLKNQTIYKVTNSSTGKIEYTSEIESKNVIDLDNRRLHLFKVNHSFYMIRITEADLTTGRRKTNFIHFMLIKLQPELKLQ